MATKVKGTDIYLKVNAGTEGAPNYQKVGGQKDASFDRGLSTVDVTDKDSGGVEEHLTGFTNWSIGFEAFLIEDDDYWLDVETSHEDRTQLLYQIITPAHTYTGKATVESLSMTGPLTEAGVVSFTLKGTGVLTKGP